MQSTTLTSEGIQVDYLDLFMALDSPYIVFNIDDPDFTIMAENEAHKKLALIADKDITGVPLLTAFPDTSASYKKTGVSELLESIRRVIRTNKKDSLKNLRYDLPQGNGTFVPRYWRVVHFPLRDIKGRVVGVVQKTEDITEQKTIEQKLERVRTQLDQALSNGSIGTWVWDIKNNLVFGDDHIARFFGLPIEDTTNGLPLEQFVKSIHPADRDRVSSEIETSVLNQDLFESEYRTLSTDGIIRWVLARGTVEVDQDGEPASFPGVIVDITDRHNAQNNLSFLTKASAQFSASLDYRKTLDSIAHMVVPDIADWCSVEVLDENGELQQVAIANQNPQDEEWAKKLSKLHRQNRREQSMVVQKVMETGKPYLIQEITEELLRKSVKTEKEFKTMSKIGMTSAMIIPLKIERKVIGVITLIAAESRHRYSTEDLEVAQSLANRASLAVENARLYQDAQRELKERKRLQRQLEQVNDALEGRVKQRTKELETVNQGLEKEISRRHEAEKIQEEYSQELMRSNQELQDFAYVASHDLQEPLRKIQAFGDLLEAEYGEQLSDGKEYLERMRSAASRMSTLIQDLLSFSRVTTKPHANVPVKLRHTVDEVLGDLEDQLKRTGGTVEVDDLPVVVADPTHMRQLFQNLIGNALKFHQPDEPPHVKVYHKQPRANARFVTIYVEDNGIGFDEKYLDRIFSVFQRLHGKESYEGTGIGLAVCRKIVERYNGTITAESKSGEGARFIMTLPLAR